MGDNINNGSLKAFRGLSKSKVFVVLCLVALFSFLVSGLLIFIANKDSLELCYTPQCFNYLFVVYKFPIQVASAFLALAGVWALVYRSDQAAAQLEITNSQLEHLVNESDAQNSVNTFNSYVAHREAFNKLVDSISKETGIRIYSKEELYIRLYPKNTPLKMSLETHDRMAGQPPELFSIIGHYNELVGKYNSLGYACSDTGITVDQRQILNLLIDVCRFVETYEIGSDYTFKVEQRVAEKFSADIPKKLDDYLRSIGSLLYALSQFSLSDVAVPVISKLERGRGYPELTQRIEALMAGVFWRVFKILCQPTSAHKLMYSSSLSG